MKISIIGVGNVGGVLASRILGFGIRQIMLIDVLGNLAEAKALDLEDSFALSRYNYNIFLKGSQDMQNIHDSDIVVITAGISRKPGMTREELLKINATVVKEISFKIKELCPQAIVLVVTNPVDTMTYVVLKITGFSPDRVLGVGINLDTARFTNLISKRLNIAPSEIEAMVIGAHGETMLPLKRFTFIRKLPLASFLEEAEIDRLIEQTVNRGAQIVSLYRTTSAYFAPSLAIAELIEAIINNKRKIIGVSTYLDGEYKVRDICIGVPCILSRKGREKVVELDLNSYEEKLFLRSVESIREQKEILQQDGII